MANTEKLKFEPEKIFSEIIRLAKAGIERDWEDIGLRSAMHTVATLSEAPYEKLGQVIQESINISLADLSDPFVVKNNEDGSIKLAGLKKKIESCDISFNFNVAAAAYFYLRSSLVKDQDEDIIPQIKEFKYHFFPDAILNYIALSYIRFYLKGIKYTREKKMLLKTVEEYYKNLDEEKYSKDFKAEKINNLEKMKTIFEQFDHLIIKKHIETASEKRELNPQNFDHKKVYILMKKTAEVAAENKHDVQYILSFIDGLNIDKIQGELLQEVVEALISDAFWGEYNFFKKTADGKYIPIIPKDKIYESLYLSLFAFYIANISIIKDKNSWVAKSYLYPIKATLNMLCVAHTFHSYVKNDKLKNTLIDGYDFTNLITGEDFQDKESLLNYLDFLRKNVDENEAGNKTSVVVKESYAYISILEKMFNFSAS